MFAARTGWDLQPNPFAQALAKARARGAPLLDLTGSNPTTAGLAYDREGIAAALANREIWRYDPQPFGLLVAREAVAAYYAEPPRQVTVDPSSICITTSTSEAYTYAIRLLCDAGDQVLVPRPSYPLFEFLADIQDIRLVPYPLFYDHGWHVDVHALAAGITARTRALIVVHPNNPSGSYLQAAEREALNPVCVRHDLALIADEVFLEYALGDPQPTFAANRAALTFTLGGLSKAAGLPQMKAGWMAISGPPALSAEALRRLEVVADAYLSPNALIQQAFPGLLASRGHFQRGLMQRLQTNLAQLDVQLRGQTACSRLETAGGWYAILRVPADRSDEALAIELIEKQAVVAHPGHFFDLPETGYLVISLIGPEAELAAGIKRLVVHCAGSAATLPPSP